MRRSGSAVVERPAAETTTQTVKYRFISLPNVPTLIEGVVRAPQILEITDFRAGVRPADSVATAAGEDVEVRVAARDTVVLVVSE